MKSSKGLVFASTLALIMSSGSVLAETADDVKCNKCVHAKDLAFGSVNHWKIKKGAVTTRHISNEAVSWEKLAFELQARIESLEARISALEEVSNPGGHKLYTYVEVDESDLSNPIVRFTGANVQIVNGTGSTGQVNGLGNLIIGYDEPLTPDGYIPVCSDGLFATEADCIGGGGTWATNHKDGSHNVVIGPGHRYSQAGGLLAGRRNAVTMRGGSVLGGHENVASGLYSSVSAGSRNIASGDLSAVIGGHDNTASAFDTLVSGGEGNTAESIGSVVLGGRKNTATGYDEYNGRPGDIAAYSVVVGGRKNFASGQYAVVGGGEENNAYGHTSVVTGGIRNRGGSYANATDTDDGKYSVVAGGRDNLAGGIHSFVGGGYENNASGRRTVVTGGYRNEASGLNSVVGGGSMREAPDTLDWVAGSLWQDF